VAENDDPLAFGLLGGRAKNRGFSETARTNQKEPPPFLHRFGDRGQFFFSVCQFRSGELAPKLEGGGL